MLQQVYDVATGELLRRNDVTHPQAPATRADDCVWHADRDLAARDRAEAGTHHTFHRGYEAAATFATVVLKRTGSGGFFILTGFPTP